MMQCVHVCQILVLKSITAFVMCWTLSCKWRWALLSCLMLNRNMRASSLGFFAVAWLTTPMQGIYFTMIRTEHSTNLAFWFCFASSTLQPHAGRALDLILVFMHLRPSKLLCVLTVPYRLRKDMAEKNSYFCDSWENTGLDFQFCANDGGAATYCFCMFGLETISWMSDRICFEIFVMKMMLWDFKAWKE